MDINQVQNNSKVSPAVNNPKVLKNGSQVLVRILSSLGNYKYEASVAGVKIAVTANNALKPGEVFVANANLKNGSIQIIPKDISQSEIFKTVLLTVDSGEIFTIIENSQVSALLNSIGLPSNNLAFSIFQQMKQLEMQMDKSTLSRIYNLALKFKGKEKKASELMILLKQKGIDFSEEDIENLLNEEIFLDKDKNFTSINQKNNDNWDFNQFGKKIQDFILSLDNQNGEAGLLTVMNHLGWKKPEFGKTNSNGSWVVLPYEIINQEISEIKGKGDIRFFLDVNKKANLIKINCVNQKGEYNFLINNAKEKLGIKFNFDGEFNSVDKIVEKLKSYIKSEKPTEIEFVDKKIIEGFCAGTEQFISVEGVV